MAVVNLDWTSFLAAFANLNILLFTERESAADFVSLIMCYYVEEIKLWCMPVCNKLLTVILFLLLIFHLTLDVMLLLAKSWPWELRPQCLRTSKGSYCLSREVVKGRKGLQSFTRRHYKERDSAGVVEDGTNCIVDSFVFDLKELYDVCMQHTEQIWGRLISMVWLFWCCILLFYVA